MFRSLMGMAGYGTESVLESYIISKDVGIFISGFVNFGNLFNISEPQFPQLLSEIT